MAKVEINIAKINEVSENLQTIANEYNRKITELYEKISKIEENGIWVSEGEGGAAKKFISTVLKDKAPALTLGENMKSLSSKIKTYATSISNLADPNSSCGSYKIFLDTEKISNNIIPLAKKETESLKDAISMASSTSVPNGDTSWSAVISELRENSQQATNYYNRIVEMNTGLINVLTNMPEEIGNMSIIEIPKKQSVVK